MGKKLENTIIILIFTCLNYFLYLVSNDVSFYRIMENKNVLFFIFVIFFNILFFMSFFVLKIKLYKINLQNEIKTYESKLELIKEKNRSILKKKISCEESKLSSMNELLSNIAHHWRQPLSVISMLSTTMQMYDEKNINIKQIIKNSELINENVQYLSSVIDNFSNKKKNNKEVFRIDYFIDELLRKINFQDVQIRYEIKDEVSLYINKKTLFKVLSNILKNSKEKLIKRDSKYKIIYLDIDSTEKELLIKIKDSAGGISQEYMCRVFEPYFTTKHKTLDVGLGLYISYICITQELKGKIEVENVKFLEEQSGEEVSGAQFSMVIPRI